MLVGLDLVAPPHPPPPPDTAPSVDAGPSYTVVEGGSVTVAATGNDPEGAPITYRWDLDGNGSFETAGRMATFSAAGLQAPASRTIRVVAVDPGGHTATDTATVGVIWDFHGFLSPIVDLPKLNGVKPGKLLRIRFSLDGDQGLAVLAADAPSLTPISCTTGAPKGPAQVLAKRSRVVLPGQDTGTYSLIWKTAKGSDGVPASSRSR